MHKLPDKRAGPSSRSTPIYRQSLWAFLSDMGANKTSGRQLSSRCWRMIFMESCGECDVANSSRSPRKCQDKQMENPQLGSNFFSSTSKSFLHLNPVYKLCLYALVFHGSFHYAERFEKCRTEARFDCVHVQSSEMRTSAVETMQQSPIRS
jgi:hypothetical protein